MRSRGVCVVVTVIAVVAVVVPGLALAGSMADTGGPTTTGAASNTSIAVQPRANGDARIRVSTRFVLDDVNDSAAFRGLGREFEAGNAGVSVSTFRWAANGSSVATGRTMNVTNVTRNATVAGANASRTDVGRLTLSFTWTAFARTEDGRVVVGDAFNGTDGTWLPGLTANQTLRIESPAGYTITRSPTGITNGTVVFEGPTTFEPGSPTVWFERRNPPSTPGEAPDTGFLGRFESIPPATLGVGSLVIIVAVVMGVYAFFERRRTDSTDDRAAAAPATEPSPPEPPESTDPSETSADETPAELLSDEERVERLLTENGGRMKQASIVDETGWSNAKVSQLLSAMDDADRVDKLRIGRENLISLPGEESAFRNR